LSIRFQADNDLKFGIVKAVRRREPTVDFLSAQESGLDSVPDPVLLDRVAAAGRVLVSHDRRTMIDHFRDHLAVGKSSPGLLIVSQGSAIGEVVAFRSGRTSRSGLLPAVHIAALLYSLSPSARMTSGTTGLFVDDSASCSNGGG
jgi:hypothetical protein